MTPRIRSFAPEAPQVFREFVAQLERLSGAPPKKAPRAKRPQRPKAKSPRKSRRPA